MAHSIWLVGQGDDFFGVVILLGAQIGEYRWHVAAWRPENTGWFDEVQRTYLEGYDGQNVDDARRRMREVLRRFGYRIEETQV
jgi:hypothetical protein